MGRGPRARRTRRVLADSLFAGAAALVGFLILSWPLVRTPPLDAASALAFVFGVWAAFIVLLAVMSIPRAGGAGRRGGR